MEINHKGSLMTHEVDGDETCLGFLLMHDGAVYEPSIGKVDVTLEDMETHNHLLDEALVSGLNLCPVGQSNLFYIRPDKTVTTWVGTVVGQWTRQGSKIIFGRGAMVFEGGYTNEEAVFFKRII
jgi:hypothetical protein